NVFFFFSSRRRHTRFSRDWSSDVCSSDLRRVTPIRGKAVREDNTIVRCLAWHHTPHTTRPAHRIRSRGRPDRTACLPRTSTLKKIGRASCREREKSRMTKGESERKRNKTR